jgi:DNA-directed RNA polymerase specialized sigma subunit
VDAAAAAEVDAEQAAEAADHLAVRQPALLVEFHDGRLGVRAQLGGGGKRQRVDLDTLEPDSDDRAADLLVLHDALAVLESHDRQAAQLVKLRYFAGLTHQQAAEALGLGRRAADRLWALARAWLYQQLNET